MRTFIAVEISEEQRDKLRELQESFKSLDLDVKYVESENLHVTLRFLGEILEGDLEGLEESCKKAVEGIAPFTMGLRGVGVFPGLNYIKIVWVGVETGSPELVGLKKNLDQFVKIGKIDSREFSPHITIARVKSARNKEKLIEKINEFSGAEFGENSVNELVVKKSELTPEGPVYSDLFRVKLKEV